MLTLSEAADIVGLTRAGLHKAIKSGRISATKDNDGQWQVDPAELFRVYQPVNAESSTNTDNRLTIVDSELIAQRLELTERLLRQVESERDHLKEKLNQAMTMLSYQPHEPHSKDVVAGINTQSGNDRLLRKIFRGRGT